MFAQLFALAIILCFKGHLGCYFRIKTNGNMLGQNFYIELT